MTDLIVVEGDVAIIDTIVLAVDTPVAKVYVVTCVATYPIPFVGEHTDLHRPTLDLMAKNSPPIGNPFTKIIFPEEGANWQLFADVGQFYVHVVLWKWQTPDEINILYRRK